jgi:glutamate racemase
VPLVEEGWFEHQVTFEVAEEYLNKLKNWGVDTLVLGCTHYPLLKPVLQRVMGNGVTLIDSAQEVSQEVEQVLNNSKLARTQKRSPRYQFIVSDEPQHFKKAARQFLGFDISQVKRYPV